MKFMNKILVAILVFVATSVSLCEPLYGASNSTLIYTQTINDCEYKIYTDDNGYINCPQIEISADEITILSKVVYGEARGISSDLEKSAIVWVVLNRVDEYEETIKDVVTKPYQFCYSYYYPVWDELYNLCLDIVYRWKLEKIEDLDFDIQRTLPNDYFFYYGDGEHNYFRKSLYGEERFLFWDWSLLNPYKN